MGASQKGSLLREAGEAEGTSRSLWHEAARRASVLYPPGLGPGLGYRHTRPYRIVTPTSLGLSRCGALCWVETGPRSMTSSSPVVNARAEDYWTCGNAPTASQRGALETRIGSCVRRPAWFDNLRFWPSEPHRPQPEHSSRRSELRCRRVVWRLTAAGNAGHSAAKPEMVRASCGGALGCRS